MGEKFWGTDIQAEIAKAMTPSDLPNFFLVKNPSTVRNPSRLAGGVNSTQLNKFSIHGTIITLSKEDLDTAPEVQKDDATIGFVAKTLEDQGVEVEISDFIQIQGKIRSIIWAKIDGSRAWWKVMAR